MGEQETGSTGGAANKPLSDLKSFVYEQMQDTSRKGIHARRWGVGFMALSLAPLSLAWWTLCGDVRSLLAWTPGVAILVAIPMLFFLALWLIGRGWLAVAAAYGLRSGQWTDIYAYLLAGSCNAGADDRFLEALVLTNRAQAADVWVKSLPDPVIETFLKRRAEKESKIRSTP
jgi:hypothetical protein